MTGTRAAAHAHLMKAKEFLTAAASNLEQGLRNAAVSNAVTSGINAKDAICLALTGASGKSDDHGAAQKELRQAGPDGAAVAADLGRLLAMKTKSQYAAEAVSDTDARKAVAYADRLTACAITVLRG